ncbi:MAG: 4Fe-4S binding protein [Acidobacteria bacterium]|nr:4Fe-4S binding protein [Acidobacteriota bacterium]
MEPLTHSIIFDGSRCVACTACCQACPSKAIRVRGGKAAADPVLCVDCGECVRVCPHDAVSVRTSSPSDLKRFRYTVAIPSITLYTQFGAEVHPGQVLAALRRCGFDAAWDQSWICEMAGAATDTYLSECKGPWPKITATCPAILRLLTIRYPDLIPHVLPLETPRELTAKLARRKLAATLRIPPEEIGVFHITPCSAIMQSIVAPVGLAESHIDGAFSVAEMYGPLRRALRELEGEPQQADESFSPRGLGWAQAGGPISGMRNANTMAVSGVKDTLYVFDRIESGRFEGVDLIEAYICPDGCVDGQLLIEGRFSARRTLQRIIGRIQAQNPVQEEKVRSLFRAHFFDMEGTVRARNLKPIAGSLQQAIQRHQEKVRLLERLPGRNCAGCGAPDCGTLADDILAGAAALADCPFVKLEELEARLNELGGRAGSPPPRPLSGPERFR